MTISDRLQVGPYEVDTALRLIGPADFGILEPQGCCDYLALIIKTIAVNILRVLNFICGDHQWYDNHTARTIVDQYIELAANNPVREAHLLNRILELAQSLSLRANGNVSCADGLDNSLLQLRTARTKSINIPK